MKGQQTNKFKKRTYEQIRQEAISNGVSDNFLCVGIYAQMNGYIKRRITHNYKQQTYYIKPL